MSHFRDDVEESEKLICEYLSDANPSIRPSSQLEGKTAEKIAERLGAVTDAEHIGNSYSSIGDIRVQTEENGVFYCELKFLSEGTARGTLCNISPRTPIETGVFNGTVMSWSEFLDAHGHTEYVLSELNSFDYYPDGTREDCTTELKTKEILGRHIRDLLDEYDIDDPGAFCADATDAPEEVYQAADIKRNITEFDRAKKIKYLEYLQSLPINSSRLKALVMILVAGYHKKKQIHSYMDVVEEVSHEVGGVGEVFDDYRVFYANTEEDELVTVDTAEQDKLIRELSKIPSEKYTIRFGGLDGGVNQTSMIVGVDAEDGFKSLLRFSLHWGNVFQGIRTKRLNGFRESYLKELTDS